MKRLLALVPAAVLVLAGCGDTCSSNPATVALQSTTCTLAPGSTATVTVNLCAKCTDSSPSCQVGFDDHAEPGHVILDVAPFVQQCQENAGCPPNGCNIQAPRATCQATIPASAAAGSYDIVISGVTMGTLTVASGGGTTCTL